MLGGILTYKLEVWYSYPAKALKSECSLMVWTPTRDDDCMQPWHLAH